MPRIIVAAIVGAIVYYVWGMLAWMAVPLHAPTIAPLPQEERVLELFKSQDLASGVYVTPFATDPAEMGDPNSKFSQNHAAGPIFSVYFHREGSVPMNVGMLSGGFIIDLIAAFLVAFMISCLNSTWSHYWRRVTLAAGLGIFVAIIGHLSYWNWMYFPLGYTVAFMIDVVVGWTLAGLAIAALVPAPVSASPLTPPSPPSAAPASTKPTSPKPVKPQRNDALSLLAALQREARFVDIVKEPLDDYSDAQVGAATRDVLRDCGAVLDRLFQITPIVDEDEGATVAVPENADQSVYRFTGNSQASATSGSLVHHGWKAERCELPQWTGSSAAARILAAAEIEIK